MKGSLNYSLRPLVTSKDKKKDKMPEKDVILKADRRWFTNMVLVATCRNLDMREYLKHPLGPLPWALSNCDGTLKKTNQSISKAG